MSAGATIAVTFLWCPRCAELLAFYEGHWPEGHGTHGLVDVPVGLSPAMQSAAGAP